MKEVAPLNISHIDLTFETFQLLSGWLKELAFPNIPPIVVTLDNSSILLTNIDRSQDLVLINDPFNLAISSSQIFYNNIVKKFSKE